MFDVLASTYMTASRMDHWLEQDFMHRNPKMAARLRHIHGLDDPSIRRSLRGRIGMDGAIERAHQPSRLAAIARSIVATAGKALRRTGEWMEDAATPTFRREVCLEG